MKIELKNVHYSARFSEETMAFDAVIYVDGKKAGTADNHGTGGPTNINPPALEKQIEAYARTLPQVDLGEPGEPHLIDNNAELLIGKLLSAHLIAKDFDRAIKGRVMYTRTDKPGVYSTKGKMTDADITRHIKMPGLREKWHVKQFLNELPRDEALKIYSTP